MATTARAMPPPVPTAWRMPIALEGYDRAPALSPDERAALDLLVRRSHAALVTADACRARVVLRRLDSPLGDVARLRPASATRQVVLRRILFREMARRGTA